MPFVDNFRPVGNGFNPISPVSEVESGVYDPYLRRPFIPEWSNKPHVLVNTGRWSVEKGKRVPLRESVPVVNLLNSGVITPVLLAANATALRKEQWIHLDTAILKSVRPRLKAWADLVAANTFGGFNAMGKMTLEYEAMSDPGFAVTDMEGLAEGHADAPLFKLRSLPLPLTYSDFWFSQRRLEVSRGGDTPFDTTMGEAAGRRVAESLEMTCIGTGGFEGLSYGGVTSGPTAHDPDLGSTVYGYLTYPNRVTKTDVTAPTAANWHPGTLLNEFLECIRDLRLTNFHGPFVVYTSFDWDPYLDNDYYVLVTSGAANMTPSRTLRDRLRQIEGIQDVRSLDFLGPTNALRHEKIIGNHPFTLVFVQMTSDVARAVVGQDITTVQWETRGGLQIHWRVMTIQVPNLRSDYNGKCGILQATTS